MSRTFRIYKEYFTTLEDDELAEMSEEDIQIYLDECSYDCFDSVITFNTEEIKNSS